LVREIELETTTNFNNYYFISLSFKFYLAY
jgi:hypothetical protein